MNLSFAIYVIRECMARYQINIKAVIFMICYCSTGWIWILNTMKWQLSSRRCLKYDHMYVILFLSISFISHGAGQLIDILEKDDEIGEEEDEVFIGPVGFKEKCVATNAELTIAEQKPMSPPTAEQYASLFKEAMSLSLELQRNSSKSRSSSSNSSDSDSSVTKASGRKTSVAPCIGQYPGEFRCREREEGRREVCKVWRSWRCKAWIGVLQAWGEEGYSLSRATRHCHHCHLTCQVPTLQRKRKNVPKLNQREILLSKYSILGLLRRV